MKKILKMFLFAFVVLLFGMCVVPDEYSWLSVILYFFVWGIVFLAGQKLILILPENWKWIKYIIAFILLQLLCLLIFLVFLFIRSIILG